MNKYYTLYNIRLDDLKVIHAANFRQAFLQTGWPETDGSQVSIVPWIDRGLRERHKESDRSEPTDSR